MESKVTADDVTNNALTPLSFKLTTCFDAVTPPVFGPVNVNSESELIEIDSVSAK